MEEISDILDLQYADLVALLSDLPDGERDRLDSISKSVMQSLGRDGPGLLSINGVPKADALRNTLLPLARKLALLNDGDRKRILKEHDLGSDVPLKNLGRIVSSFAKQMKFGAEFDVNSKGTEVSREVGDDEFGDLGFTFQELGFCMMDLGILFARVCDKLIGGSELEQSLLQSGTAKGRLIHYHSIDDNALIKQSTLKKQHCVRNGKANIKEDASDDVKQNLWQQWHYDYGIFTILTVPMFRVLDGIDCEECESPSGHTYLQVYHPKIKRIVMVRASRGSFIVQVGESANILSKGKLRATLHSVCRPTKIDNLSRETFVVFLQPSWSKTFSLLDYPIEHDDWEWESESCNEVGSNGLAWNIDEIVPPLSLRLQDGMTFAEFSKQTTKQYYGRNGLQPNQLG